MPRAKTLCIALLIAAAAFLSYEFNAFKVTTDGLFISHQLDSERLVLDGLLHGRHKDGTLRLGTYSRPGMLYQDPLVHLLYTKKNKKGVFSEYQSQFGLQLYFFSALAGTLSDDVDFLQSVCALLMALVVAGFYLALEKEFSPSGALCFCIPLVFSPWVVIFARNLYWVEATWFLPTLVTLVFGKGAFESGRRLMLMLLLLSLALLVKFLCGYEYITTIVIAAFVPLVYYAVKSRVGVRRTVMPTLLVGICVLLAFGVAVTFHARNLSSKTGTPYHRIAVIAKKRLLARDVDALASEACKDVRDQKGCAEKYMKTFGPALTCSSAWLMTRYFDMQHFLPWADRIVLSTDDVAAVKEVAERRSIASVGAAIYDIGFSQTVLIGYKAVGMVGFPLFSLLAAAAVLRRRGDALALALLVSLLAPLSWFTLAKGHSYHHFHMNYVLWYLLFVPFAMLLFFHRTDLKPQALPSLTSPIAADVPDA